MLLYPRLANKTNEVVEGFKTASGSIEGSNKGLLHPRSFVIKLHCTSLLVYETRDFCQICQREQEQKPANSESYSIVVLAIGLSRIPPFPPNMALAFQLMI